MKYRRGFVTNSSSSSFLIAKKYLSDKQIEAIRNHSELGQKLHLQWANESWDIDENDDFITGYTYMDNFDISELFKIIGIPFKNIFWNEFGFDLDNLEDYVEKDEDNEDEKEEDWRRILDEINREY